MFERALSGIWRAKMALAEARQGFAIWCVKRSCRFSVKVEPTLNDGTTQGFFIYREEIPVGIVQADYQKCGLTTPHKDKPLHWTGRRSDNSNGLRGESLLDAIRRALADHEPTPLEVEVVSVLIRNHCILRGES